MKKNCSVEKFYIYILSTKVYWECYLGATRILYHSQTRNLRILDAPWWYTDAKRGGFRSEEQRSMHTIEMLLWRHAIKLE